MKNITFFLFSIVLTIVIALNSASAQTVTGPTSVETCTSNTYTVGPFTLPTGATFKNFTWSVTNNAPSANSPAPFNGCGGTINSVITNSVLITNMSNTTIVVNWGDFFAPATSTVSVAINYVLGNSTGKLNGSLSVSVLGVCSNTTMTGKPAVQRCCTESLTYSISDNCTPSIFGFVGSGLSFLWAVPNGWTITGGQGTTSITVIPDNQIGGNVSCNVSRPASGGGTNKTFTFDVTRFDPTISITAKGGIDGISNLCPGATVSYSASASTCGLIGTNWSVPKSWSILSGQGTSNTTVKVGIAGSSGNITATATYNGGCVASNDLAVDVLTTSPPNPIMGWDKSSGDYTYYHCGEWFICPRDGEAQITALIKKGTTSITWTISAPWRFNGGSQTITETVNITGDTYRFSPYIEADCAVKSGGVIEIFSSNCLGQSAVSSTNFLREVSGWCKNGCRHTCYPSNQPCLGVSDEFKCKGPFNKVANNGSSSIDANEEISPIDNETAMENELVISPNPNGGTINIKSREDIIRIRVLETNGKVVLDQKIAKAKQHQMDLPNPMNGIYFLEVSSENTTKIEKIIIQH